VIDFGSSCHANQRMYSYIQSRFYRSPEVMLGLSYGCAIDMWSLGCILVEMHTGEPLFSGADQSDQMRKLVDVLGMPSDELILQAERGYRDQYFQQVQDHDDGAPEWRLCQRAGTEDDAAAAAAASPARGISDILGVESGGPGGRHLGDAGHSPLHYEMFVDFVKQMLQYRCVPVCGLRSRFSRACRTPPLIPATQPTRPHAACRRAAPRLPRRRGVASAGGGPGGGGGGGRAGRRDANVNVVISS